MAADPGSSANQDDPAFQAAMKRAEELQGFYTHVLIYLVVNIGLFFINLLGRGDGGGWWFFWPLAGWGIGLLVHATVTYTGLFSESWKARKAAEIYERSRRAPG
ncbi:MAG TPA: 2TM domain-containing protein [Actinomycetota bacterium]|nr:2TM domain-containing protein [Actinomycetota bacterium]